MDFLTIDKIKQLLNIRKLVLDDIEWKLRSESKKIYRFNVNVISEREDMLGLEGYLNFNTQKILLTLRFDVYPLISLHSGKHRNPEGTNPLFINDWHKHPFTIKYGRDYAYEVNHEFNDHMTPEEVVRQFFIENRLKFVPGKHYIHILDDFSKKQ